MGIREMESRYRELREKFVTGAISREIFEAQVAQLRYQDVQGRYWALDLQKGRWHVYEDGRWRRDKPALPVDPKCAYCGQLLPPGSERCVLCGRNVPSPPPPPFDTVPTAPELPSLTPEEEQKRRPWLRIAAAIAVGLVLAACLFCIIDGILLYTKTAQPIAGLPAWPIGGADNTVEPTVPTPTRGALWTATAAVAATASVPATTQTQPLSTRPAPTPTRSVVQTITPSPSGTLVVQSSYENVALGFQLRYPTGWTYEEQRDGAIFAAHKDDLDRQDFVDGCFFVVNAGTDLTKTNTPQAALGELVDNLEGEDILIGKVQTDTLDTEAAAGVLVSLTPTGEDITLEMYLLVAFHADQPYVVMAAAPVERWRATWPAYQEMLRSFRFVERPTTPTPTSPPATATPRRTARPQPTPTPVSGTGFQYRQDGPVEPGPGDCKGTALVWGYVHDVDGQVMDGVYLFVWYEGGDWGPAPQVARTDIKGVYRLQLLTGQKGTFRVMVIQGWQDRTPLSPPSDAVMVDDYCEHSGFKVNWRQITPKTPTPTLAPPPTVVSDYPFEKDGDVKLSEPNCGKQFKVQGRISGLDEFSGRIMVKVRSPDDTLQAFPEAVRSDGTYTLPTLPTYYTGDYLIWLEDKSSGERISDHAVFSGVDPCEGFIFEINWKRRK